MPLSNPKMGVSKIITSRHDNHVTNPKGTGKRGHIVADTLLLMMFIGVRKLGNICCGPFPHPCHSLFLSRSPSGIISGPGSFVVQFGDHLRSWDHLRTRTELRH